MKNYLSKGFDSIIKYAQKEDMAEVLAVTGALGWGLSCLAYTGAILLNKGIPSDQKKFLVPQELADGVINVSLFWFLTSKAKKFGESLINEGKVLPNQLKEKVVEFKEKNSGKFSVEDFEKHLKAPGQDPAHIIKLREFQRSFPVLVSITGSIIAANIFTPIVRNIVASRFQKTHTSPVVQEKPATAQPPRIIKPLPVNSYSLAPKGQMKV